MKRTSSWNRACEELKRYQKQLDKLREETDNFTKPFVDSSSDESDDEDIIPPKENPLVVATIANAEVDEDDDDDREDEEDESSDASPTKRGKVAANDVKCDETSVVKKEPAGSHQRTKIAATKSFSDLALGESVKTTNSKIAVVSMMP